MYANGYRPIEYSLRKDDNKINPKEKQTTDSRSGNCAGQRLVVVGTYVAGSRTSIMTIRRRPARGAYVGWTFACLI